MKTLYFNLRFAENSFDTPASILSMNFYNKNPLSDSPEED
jgi:hypothetical protein